MPPCRMLAARERGNRRGETGRRARDVDDRPAIFGDGHVSAAILETLGPCPTGCPGCWRWPTDSEGVQPRSQQLHEARLTVRLEPA
jgi:hypothetical protein